MSYVFLGPSLAIHEAKEILPQGNFLPPVQKGDLLNLIVEKKPRAIGIIDGYFSQTLSIWHKEIVYGLNQGVKILGASSMGALRAVETHPCGMIGIGKIYRMFQSGVIDGDDEVAVIHGPKEMGFINFSLPMVNIRCTLAEALEKSHIDQATHDRWIATAKSLFYPLRTLSQISQNLSPSEKTLFFQIFTEQYIDQKKLDAKRLLQNMAADRIPDKEFETMHHSVLFNHFFYQDRPSSLGDDMITQKDIVKYLALHHPNFSRLKEQALNRLLAKFLAKILQIQVTDEEKSAEIQRFKQCKKLQLPHELPCWLQENHLAEEEFDHLIEDRAILRKLYQSPIGEKQAWNVHKYLLDELKVHDDYSRWVKSAVLHYRQIPDSYWDIPFKPSQKKEIFLAHLRNSSWDLDVDCKTWCEENGFTHLQELLLELDKAQFVRQNSCKDNHE